MELQNKIDEIGKRFLVRTRGELPHLKTQFQQLQASTLADKRADQGAGEGAAVAREMEMMVHKMHGSGSMLGFDAISELSGEMEQLLARQRTEPGSLLEEIMPRLATLLGELEAAIDKAAPAPP